MSAMASAEVEWPEAEIGALTARLRLHFRWRVAHPHTGEYIRGLLGPIARPDKVFFTAELPKTLSAKIMRRRLSDIGEGRVIGDMTTLADPTMLAEIRSQYEEKEG